MPIVSMRQLLDHAAENGYGIPAFNVNNLEQVQAVMSAAAEVGAGGREEGFCGGRLAEAAAEAAAAIRGV